MAVRVSVAVVIHGVDLEYAESWELHFEFESGPLVCKFAVTEPYLVPLERWRALASAEEGTHLHLYQGSGSGSIACAKGEYHFVAAPSGGGGDVDATISVGTGAVSGRLTEALNEAVGMGLPFQLAASWPQGRLTNSTGDTTITKYAPPQ